MNRSIVGIVCLCLALATTVERASSSILGGAPCRGGATVIVAVAFDAQTYPDVGGLRVRLGYPPRLLAIPGSKSEDAVQARVKNLTGIHSDESSEEVLFGAADIDTDRDGQDDQVVIGLVTQGAPISPGRFARVTFDCVPGTSLPDVSALSCTVTGSTRNGTSVAGLACSVTSLEGAPSADSSAGSPAPQPSTSKRSSNM